MYHGKPADKNEFQKFADRVENVFRCIREEGMDTAYLKRHLMKNWHRFRKLVMMINSILREVIPTIKCVNSLFKYEKLSHSVNQFTFVVKVHSFLKK